MAGGKPYIRNEDRATRAFYKSYAPFYKQTPDTIAFFVDALHERTALPSSGASFPADIQTLGRTADAFADAARSVFAFSLDVDSADGSQLDRFIDTHLVQPQSNRVPNEPLLYYALGCFWGEWLKRHRNAAWALYAPLNPIQSFPDGISTSNTICLQPFSQVNKKLADPEGDCLEYKAGLTTSDRKYLPPYPLLASIADADQAVQDLLPQSANRALAAMERGDPRALDLFVQAIKENPTDARILDFAVGCAWDQEDWDHVREFLRRLIELCPDRPHFMHNLAITLSGDESTLPEAISLLERAIAVDPSYARGHLTLADIYNDLGEKTKAMQHCQWVIDNDEELKADAQELLKQIRA